MERPLPDLAAFLPLAPFLAALPFAPFLPLRARFTFVAEAWPAIFSASSAAILASSAFAASSSSAFLPLALALVLAFVFALVLAFEPFALSSASAASFDRSLVGRADHDVVDHLAWAGSRSIRSPSEWPPPFL